MNSTNDREPEPIFQAGHAGSIPVARSFMPWSVRFLGLLFDRLPVAGV
jgi:hypothetical protein